MLDFVLVKPCLDAPIFSIINRNPLTTTHNPIWRMGVISQKCRSFDLFRCFRYNGPSHQKDRGLVRLPPCYELLNAGWIQFGGLSAQPCRASTPVSVRLLPCPYPHSSGPAPHTNEGQFRSACSVESDHKWKRQKRRRGEARGSRFSLFCIDQSTARVAQADISFQTATNHWGACINHITNGLSAYCRRGVTDLEYGVREGSLSPTRHGMTKIPEQRKTREYHQE